MHTMVALPPLHLLGHFSDPYAGAERELPDLAQALAGRRACVLWSDVPPHPHYAAMGVRAIDAAAGIAPRGGMLLLGGVHVALGPWMAEAGFDRIALRYNLPQHRRLFELVAWIDYTCGMRPELLFVTDIMRASVGLPGTIEPSLIDLAPYLGVARPPAGSRPFTFGRVSRDVPEKHDPDDIGLYRLLAAQGLRVRLMGATCLAPWLEGVPGVELLPAGHQPVAEFLGTLDAFFYRTGGFEEPYGRVVLEAMASGLPVVASRRGGFSTRIRHGEDGFLVEGRDGAARWLLQLAGDAALRAHVGHAARESAVRVHGAQAIEAGLQFYLRPAAPGGAA